jgi:hypothetical protein
MNFNNFVIHANKAEYATFAHFKNRRHIASMLELFAIQRQDRKKKIEWKSGRS